MSVPFLLFSLCTFFFHIQILVWKTKHKNHKCWNQKHEQLLCLHSELLSFSRGDDFCPKGDSTLQYKQRMKSINLLVVILHLSVRAFELNLAKRAKNSFVSKCRTKPEFWMNVYCLLHIWTKYGHWQWEKQFPSWSSHRTVLTKWKRDSYFKKL